MARQNGRLSETFAANLKAAMTEADVRPEQLARDLDVSMRLVQKWRAGNSRPGDANLVRLARRLDKPVSFFFEDSEVAA